MENEQIISEFSKEIKECSEPQKPVFEHYGCVRQAKCLWGPTQSGKTTIAYLVAFQHIKEKNFIVIDVMFLFFFVLCLRKIAIQKKNINYP